MDYLRILYPSMFCYIKECEMAGKEDYILDLVIDFHSGDETYN